MITMRIEIWGPLRSGKSTIVDQIAKGYNAEKSFIGDGGFGVNGPKSEIWLLENVVNEISNKLTDNWV